MHLDQGHAFLINVCNVSSGVKETPQRFSPSQISHITSPLRGEPSSYSSARRGPLFCGGGDTWSGCYAVLLTPFCASLTTQFRKLVSKARMEPWMAFHIPKNTFDFPHQIHLNLGCQASLSNFQEIQRWHEMLNLKMNLKI